MISRQNGSKIITNSKMKLIINHKTELYEFKHLHKNLIHNVPEYHQHYKISVNLKAA